MLRGDAQSNGVYLRPESARAIDCKTRGLRWSNRARYPCADPQQRLRETMKFFAIFLTACALSVFAFAAPDAAPDPDSERIAAQGKPLKDAPAQFSARLPKERARRQNEQYGEREATQGKPLKNALEDRTSANTVCPAALSVWHTALPIKPFAPVTRIFILQFYFLLEDRKRQTDELHIYPGNIRANFTQCVVQHTRFISLLARGQAICQTDQTSA